jgi:hypothetical protein
MILQRQWWHTAHSLSLPKSSLLSSFSSPALFARFSTALTSKAANLSCGKLCRSSKSMNQTSNCLGHWGQECPPLPQWKHMRPIASFGLGGADPPTNMVGTWGGPKAFEMGGIKRETVGTNVVTHGGGFWNTLEVFGGVGAICEYI